MKTALLHRIAALALFTSIAVLAACGPTTDSESTGEYVDDSVITTKVKAAIFNDASLKSSEINVESFKGKVQLSGFVGSQADIDRAISLANGVEGVTDVTNSMQMK